MMDMNARTAPYERSVTINFDGADEGSTSIDLAARSATTTAYKFRPTGILIPGAVDAVQTIRGELWGNSGAQDYPVKCNETTPLSFRVIYNQGTTRNTFHVLGV